MSDVRNEFDAWVNSLDDQSSDEAFEIKHGHDDQEACARLAWQAATERAKRVPMTDEQMQGLWRTTLGEPHAARKSAFDFGRAIEAHHNIKGEQT